MKNRRPFLFLAIVALLAVVAWGARTLAGDPLVPFDDSADIGRVDPSFLPPEELDRLVSVYEERVTKVTTPSDYLILGGLYLEAARTSGDLSMYTAAQTMFTTADELQPEQLSARLGVARAQYALHDFEQARSTTEHLLSDSPGRLDALALLGDIQTAQGALDEAAETLRLLADQTDESPGLTIRMSQLSWLRGDHAEAMRLAEEAISSVDESPDTVRSWYESFGAQTAFRTGELQRAEELARQAFEHDPDAFLSMVTLARVIASGEPQEALGLYESAVAIIPEPEYLAALGDLEVSLGDEASAAQRFDTIEAIADLARAQGAVYDRQVARFYADHDRRLDQAVELAQGELDVRQDPEAHDTLGWALFKRGHLAEAREASDRALAGGFRSAPALYHAGLISRALGDADRARREIEDALDLNPVFDPVQAPKARRALRELS